MYHVLVPVDQDVERAKEQVEYVTSIPCATSEVNATVMYVNPADYKGAKERSFEDIESATTALEGIKAAGIEADGELRSGMISKTILEAAAEYDVDEIVMAGRDRSGVTKALLGSVTHDVTLATNRPVAVVG